MKSIDEYYEERDFIALRCYYPKCKTCGHRECKCHELKEASE